MSASCTRLFLLFMASVVVVGALVACGASNDDAATKDQADRPTQSATAAEAPAEAAPAAAAPAPEPKEPEVPAPPTTSEGWDALVGRYATPTLTADIAKLPKSEQAALKELIEASRLLEPIFDRQAWRGNPALREKLEEDESDIGAARLRYFEIHRGPWDRQEHFAPFAVDTLRPAGAGFYPEDITEAELKAWILAHPEDKAAFESLFTVIERDGDKLVARPYREVYAEWLVPAAEKLKKAAKLTKNKSLQKFLKSRADAFLSDDYYPSDKDWMDLDSPVEITIGPYEVYEDNLMGWKASYESFVTVTDPAASKQLAKFKKMLPDMEANLPVPDDVKTKRGAESPIRVVDLVFTAGDARKSVQTIAFNLPNDERVRAEKGAKKVLLRNAIETKFDKILRPIAAEVLAADQQQHLDASAFFHEVLFHELSHSLGPAFVGNKGETEVRVALGASYSTVEEAKADVMGAYNILYLIGRGEFPAEFREKLLVSYFAGLFRSVRFGVAEAHGRGAALQINYLVEKGGASFDGNTKSFKVDMKQLEAGIRDLVAELCMLQHNGDKAAVDAMLDKYGVMSPAMATALEKLEGIPVDIRPVFPLAGEGA